MSDERMPDIGTRVMKAAPVGFIWGSTASLVDAFDYRLQVQWDGEAEPRTEDLKDLIVPDATSTGASSVDPARGPLAARQEQFAPEEVILRPEREQEVVTGDTVPIAQIHLVRGDTTPGSGHEEFAQPDGGEPIQPLHNIGEVYQEIDGMLDSMDDHVTFEDVVQRLRLLHSALRDGIMENGYSFPSHASNEEQRELEAWWHEQADRELAPLIAKMKEYGGHGRALDLSWIGEALTDAGLNWNLVARHPLGEEAGKQELGIYFYVMGKFGRWAAAVAEGRPVSDDTIYDMGIYLRMLQRIRQVGGWPK